MAIAMNQAEVNAMPEIMVWKAKRCAPTPNDESIRAMSNEQLGELIDSLLDLGQGQLDAVNGALFDVAFNEMARRVPIQLVVRRGFGPIT